MILSPSTWFAAADRLQHPLEHRVEELARFLRVAGGQLDDAPAGLRSGRHHQAQPDLHPHAPFTLAFSSSPAAEFRQPNFRHRHQGKPSGRTQPWVPQQVSPLASRVLPRVCGSNIATPVTGELE